MPKLIENQIIRLHTINLSENESVIEYLKNTNTKFVLQHISKKQFERASSNRMTNILSRSSRYIARYDCDSKKAIKGVELTDENREIVGSFVINDNQIIYLPIDEYFNYEPNLRGEFGTTYYTNMTMIDLLQNSIRTRKSRYNDLECLIYVGLNSQDKAIFQTATEDELLMYSTNRTKGIELVKEIQSKRRLN